VTCSGGGARVGFSRCVGRAVELQVVHTVTVEHDVGLDRLRQRRIPSEPLQVKNTASGEPDVLE
jgi:hypothetical protein